MTFFSWFCSKDLSKFRNFLKCFYFENFFLNTFLELSWILSCTLFINDDPFEWSFLSNSKFNCLVFKYFWQVGLGGGRRKIKSFNRLFPAFNLNTSSLIYFWKNILRCYDSLLMASQIRKQIDIIQWDQTERNRREI